LIRSVNPVSGRTAVFRLLVPGTVLPKVFVVDDVKVADNALDSNTLRPLLAYGAVNTRRHHFDCRLKKHDYKKSGRTKPGLRTEDFFVGFVFCLKDPKLMGEPDRPGTPFHFQLLFSPALTMRGGTMDREEMAGRNMVEDEIPGRDETGRDETTRRVGTGRNEMTRRVGTDWDEMTKRDETR
jgi:hypothetical protein